MTAVSEPQLVRPGMNRMEAVSLMRSLVKVQLQVLKGAAVTDGVTVSEVKLQGTYPDSYSLWKTGDYTGYTSQPMDVDLFSTDPNRPFIGPVMYLPEKMMRGQSTDQDLKFTFSADLFARLSAAFGLRFLMTEPVGQLWTATLQGGYYELMVFDYLGNDITADKSKWISGKEPFTVYVIPTQPYDKNPGEGVLRIATRTWGGENDMLLINRDNRFNADDHPLQTEIRIRQIEAPVSE